EENKKPADIVRPNDKETEVIVNGDNKKPVLNVTPSEKKIDLLEEEYKFVRGRRIINPLKNKDFVEYKKLVVEEYNQAFKNGETKADFAGYLQERRKAFDAAITETVGDGASKSKIERAVADAKNIDIHANSVNGSDRRTLLTLTVAAAPAKPNYNGGRGVATTSKGKDRF
ncbi:MAG: hypothetical protein IKO06_00445, partial [Alphaproteobacteria bacterium]|nr:hypothetical protein [Alphaproteobacteria bacterium]